MKKFYSFTFIALIGIIAFQWSSCKGPQPCKATITVYDSIGTHPQANIAVHLYAQINYNGYITQGDLTANATTDASGQVNFTIKNPCILDIRATVTNCDSNSAHPRTYCLGTGIIVFEAGKTNTKSVFLSQ